MEKLSEAAADLGLAEIAPEPQGEDVLLAFWQFIQVRGDRFYVDGTPAGRAAEPAFRESGR